MGAQVITLLVRVDVSKVEEVHGLDRNGS